MVADAPARVAETILMVGLAFIVAWPPNAGGERRRLYGFPH